MGKLAFVFAGQGAQTIGMGQDLYEKYNIAKEIFDMSGDIQNLCFEGPKEELDITINTQPAVFLMDMVCAKILNEKGINAEGFAGFSLGEVPAACFAGLMSMEQAFSFVNKRAQVMQSCSEKNKGCMFAVLKLTAIQVEEICKKIPGAYPVNYNSPEQTVVACAENVSNKLEEAVIEAKGKPIKLAASGAFHSPFMNDASEKAAEYLKKESFKETNIPLYSNYTAKPYAKSMLSPDEQMAKQINHPVLWQKTITNMTNDGFDTFVEVGPGKTLSGLIKKIAPDKHIYNVSDIISLDKTVEELIGKK